MGTNLFSKSYVKTIDTFIRSYTSIKSPPQLIDQHSLSKITEATTTIDQDLMLLDVLSSAPDVWQLFRMLRLRLNPERRLLIAHTNYFWGPLLHIWRQLFNRQKTQVSWLSPSDIYSLLALNGFEVITRDHGLILPLYIPGFHWFFNDFLARLPGLRFLNLIDFYVIRAAPNFKALEADKIPQKVSLIIPTRDEAGNMEPLFKHLPKLGSQTELIFVDGNSQDGTLEKVAELAKQYGNQFQVMMLKQEGKGKGSAVRQGFDAATGDLLFVFDSDITVWPDELPKFVLALCEGGGEFVMGSRLVYPMEGEAMRTLNVLGNKFFSLAFSWLLNRPIKDTLCGTKGLSRRHYDTVVAGRDYFGDFDPFGDFDLIFGAAHANLKITEIPIRYKNRLYGEIKISRFAHGWLLLRMTWIAAKKIKFR